MSPVEYLKNYPTRLEKLVYYRKNNINTRNLSNVNSTISND